MPKKKPQKVKAPAEPTPEELAAQAKQKLIDEMKALKGEFTTELKLINGYQQSKAKLENFWMMEKKMRDDLRMELRNRFRQRQDLQEKQQFEIKVYKQKVKHLLHEQQANITDVRTDAEVALKLLQDSDRASETETKREQRALATLTREMELSHAELLQELKLTQEKHIMATRQEYERRADEMKQACEKKMKAVRKDFAKQRKADVKKIETRKNAHISQLMAKHKEEFADIKNYFSDVIHNNIDLIRQLKDEVISMRKGQLSDEKALQEISQAHKKLSEPLKKHEKETEELGIELKNYQKDKQLLKQTKDRLQVVEESMKKLSWEHEILLQKFTKAKEERDSLFQQLENSVYEMQQKAGFKRLLLEKSIEAVHDSLEKRETALHEVALSTNLPPEAVGGVSRNLETVLMEKNKVVGELEDQLREWRQAYFHVIRTYEAKLDEFGIAPTEIGFEPAQI